MKIRLMLRTSRSRLAAAVARCRDKADDLGASTVEYAMVVVAAAGFAGLLSGILKSPEMRTLLLGIIRKALSVA